MAGSDGPMSNALSLFSSEERILVAEDLDSPADFVVEDPKSTATTVVVVSVVVDPTTQGTVVDEAAPTSPVA